MLAIGAALLIVVLDRRYIKKTMDLLEKMIDAAMRGNFIETSFDESRMSFLETKLAHYLSASEVAAGNVALEKDKIKTLIADISHQTKTPIANLLLYSELLEEEDISENMRSNVEAVHAQTEKLHFLIDSLVKLSRLENGILTFSIRKEGLQPILCDVLEQMRSRAEKKELFLCLQPTSVTASFDAKWTNEALCNIVDNAIKYTKEGGVSISVTAYEFFARIDISDTGIGISKEEQTKVFSRFFRSEDVGGMEGVGIGLYLARQIISGQGGYIKMVSKKGKGTVFSVFLPV